MNKSKNQVDINIVIRLDDQLKEQLPSTDITADENVKIVTPLSVAQLAYIFAGCSLIPEHGLGGPAEILLSRYDLFVHHGMLTHLTTNLSASEIEQAYGNRATQAGSAAGCAKCSIW